MIGAWKKRPGYAKYLGTPNNDQITTLFSWRQNDSTTFHTYRYAGSTLHYSTNGTGSWTICGGGTLTEGAKIGYAVLDNTMLIGDGTAPTRFTTTGTSFGFASSGTIPFGEHWVQYQGRIWGARGTGVAGTATDVFFSTTGTAGDWTTDSSSIRIPGPGRINGLFKSNDRLVATKDSGEMYRYDGFNLVDLSTDLGPSSPQSIGEVEDFRLYLNRKGVFGYGGVRPEIVSNSVQRQIYNDVGEGITGTVFDNAPGVIHKFDYLVGVGTITDNLTDETIDDAILKYDFQLDEWVNWKFNNRPHAFHSYRDLNGDDRLIFGDSNGQAYTLGGTDLNDDGTAIEAVLEGVLHFGAPELDKKFNYVWAFSNPGNQSKIQVAITDTFTKGVKNWIDLKQNRDGVAESKFPSGSRGKLLHWKLSESSRDSRFHFYGLAIDVDFIERN